MTVSTHSPHVAPGPFLAPLVDRPVALLRFDGQPKVIGHLTGVDGDPEHPTLTVHNHDGDHAVPFDDCERIKFHLTDNRKDRHR
jgi:hypothetical protein